MTEFESINALRVEAEITLREACRLENENRVLRAALEKMASWKTITPGGLTGNVDFDDGCEFVRELVCADASVALREAVLVRNRSKMLNQNVNNLVDEYNQGRVWKDEAARALSDLLLGTRREKMPMQSDVFHCVDGFSVSVQASEFHYCSPRENKPKQGYWTMFELDFPSTVEPLLLPYKDGGEDDKADPTNTVYCSVPANVLLAVLANHGGLKEE